MLTTFVRLTERLSGFLLGALAASTPAGMVLICVGVIVFGPAYILRFLAP